MRWLKGINCRSAQLGFLFWMHGLSDAAVFESSLNDSHWQLELSPFECRMWQPVAFLGDAVFSHKAGEQQRFYLATRQPLLARGAGSIIAEAPKWDPSRASQNLGELSTKRHPRPVELKQKRAYQLLDALYDGRTPTFYHKAWFDTQESLQWVISPIHFRKAYRDYQSCLASLLPVNFDQINRSRIRFATAKYQLSSALKAQLDDVVSYVKADPSVNGFYIDGHTDTVGRRVANLELSKRRAESVTAYLVKRGVDEAMITTRYHGERYPVESNKTVAGRAANRRVTLRLERDGL